MVRNLVISLFLIILLTTIVLAEDTPFTDCIDITIAGTYVLQNDITDWDATSDYCIDIDVPGGNVWIDGDGHTITNDEASSSYPAIKVDDASDDILIKDLTIEDVQDNYGILAIGEYDDFYIDNVDVTGSKGGFYLYEQASSSMLYIYDCFIDTTSYGMFIYGFPFDESAGGGDGIHDNIINVDDTDGEAVPYGIYISSCTSGPMLIDNTVDVEGDAYGIRVSSTNSIKIESDTTAGNLDEYSSISSVDGSAVSLYNSNSCYVRYLNISSTASNGISLTGTTSSTTIDSVDVEGNAYSIYDGTSTSYSQTALRTTLKDASNLDLAQIRWVDTDFLKDLDVVGDFTYDRITLADNNINLNVSDWSGTDLTDLLGSEVDMYLYQTPSSGITDPVLTVATNQCSGPDCFDISSLVLATVYWSALEGAGNWSILNESDVGAGAPAETYSLLVSTSGSGNPLGLCLYDNITYHVNIVDSNNTLVTDATGTIFAVVNNGTINSEGTIPYAGRWSFEYNGTTTATDSILFYYNDSDYNLTNETDTIYVAESYCDLTFAEVQILNPFEHISVGESYSLRVGLFDIGTGERILDASNTIRCYATIGEFTSYTCSPSGDGECTLTFVAPVITAPYLGISCTYVGNDYVAESTGFSSSVVTASDIDLWVTSDDGKFNIPTGPIFCPSDTTTFEVYLGDVSDLTTYGDGNLTITTSSDGEIFGSPCAVSSSNPCTFNYDVRTTVGMETLTLSYTDDTNYDDISYLISIEANDDCYFAHLIVSNAISSTKSQSVFAVSGSQSSYTDSTGHVWVTKLNPTAYPVEVDLTKSGYISSTALLASDEMNSYSGIGVVLYPTAYGNESGLTYQDEFTMPTNTSQVTGGIKQIVFAFMASPFNILLMLIILLIAIGAIKFIVLTALG